jgi:6-phosphogluconolactonase
MKFESKGRLVKAAMLSLGLALGITACSNDYTVSYVYMATSRSLPHGLINAYQVDYQSGYLRALDDSPVDAGGRDTVGMVVTPDNLHLYTVNNFDSNVVQFNIGTDGKLYPENTYNIAGSLPTAAAVDAQGKFLFVTFTYQNNANGSQLYSPANPGPGGVTVFPINANYTLGTPFSVNAGRNPVGIATSASGNFVYVIDQDPATNANLLAYSENAATGALTPLGATAINAGNVVSTGYATGPMPAAVLTNTVTVAGHAAGSLLYVTDSSLGQITTYSLAGGVPTVLGTTATDATPMGMAFDLTGKYLYVVANTANAIDGYTMAANGLPVRSTVARSVQTGTGPTCVSISGAPSNANPSHAVYLYTSNSLSNNLTGEQLNSADGSLDQIQGQPFGGSALPACVVTVPALPLR